MDRSRNRKNNFAVWLTAIAVFFIFSAIAYRAYSAEAETLTRALYHARELHSELEKVNIKDREVILKKVKFIKERIREELIGSPTSLPVKEPVINKKEN